MFFTISDTFCQGSEGRLVARDQGPGARGQAAGVRDQGLVVGRGTDMQDEDMKRLIRAKLAAGKWDGNLRGMFCCGCRARLLSEAAQAPPRIRHSSGPVPHEHRLGFRTSIVAAP